MSENETEMMELLQRMQQQLVFLEKKVDTLLQQTQQRPPSFNRERNFSRPFRPPFGRPNRPDGHGPSHGHGPSRGPGRPDRGPREGNFAPKKKFFGGHGGGNHSGPNRPH